MSRCERTARVFVAALVACCATACREDMHDQARVEPYERHAFFADGRGSRHPPEGTVARGAVLGREAYRTGRDADGELVTELPVELTTELVERGRGRFDIFCAPCHGRDGHGDGMVVQRGYPKPTSFGDARMREVSVGHVFDVITNGYARMPRYDHLVPVDDRWAIVAYVEALVLSHGVPEPLLSEADRRALDGGTR